MTLIIHWGLICDFLSRATEALDAKLMVNSWMTISSLIHNSCLNSWRSAAKTVDDNKTQTKRANMKEDNKRGTPWLWQYYASQYMWKQPFPAADIYHSQTAACALISLVRRRGASPWSRCRCHGADKTTRVQNALFFTSHVSTPQCVSLLQSRPGIGNFGPGGPVSCRV